MSSKLNLKINDQEHLNHLFNHINRHLVIFEQATQEFEESRNQTDQESTDHPTKKQTTNHHIDRKIIESKIEYEPLNQYFERCLPKPQKVSTKLIGDLCAICQDCYLPDEQHYHLDCQHNFHQSCLEEWFSSHRYSILICPLCRNDHSKLF